MALTTPFSPDTNTIDVPTLERQLQLHMESGTQNLCLLGTTGEASTMSMKERATVINTAIEICKGQIPLLVGSNTPDTHHQARDLGADSVLVVTPPYVKPPQRCLVQCMVDAAKTSQLPTIIYNVPGRTGVDMTDASIAEAASAHENIVGVKDATGNVTRVGSLREELQKNNADFLLYSGDDATSLEFVRRGGDGCISVTANVAPKAMAEMMQLALQHDEEAMIFPKAEEINNHLLGLHMDLFCESNPIPVKYAMSRLGYGSPWCRPPLDTLDPSYTAVVDEALRKASLI